jgi:hypothetical protein
MMMMMMTDDDIDEGWGRPDDEDEFISRAAPIQKFPSCETRSSGIHGPSRSDKKSISQGGDESQIEVLLRLVHIQWESLRNRARGISNQAKSSQK